MRFETSNAPIGIGLKSLLELASILVACVWEGSGVRRGWGVCMWLGGRFGTVIADRIVEGEESSPSL
jgi:hypothetical protein